MSENSVMKIDQMLCPMGLKNNPNRAMKLITHVTIHCTGNYTASADAQNHARYQLGDSGGRQASWHYTTDKDYIIQSFEDERECWHAGNAKGNSCSVGIEICVNEKSGFAAAAVRAAWLTAQLLRKHNLSMDSVVQHFYWSGKNCPSELRSGIWGYDWADFLAQVRAYVSLTRSLEDFNAK